MPAAPPRRLLRRVPPATPPTPPLMILVSSHRHLLQDRANRLAAENASNDLNDNRKYGFHFEFPFFSPHIIIVPVNTGPSYAIGQAERYVVHRSHRSIAFAVVAELAVSAQRGKTPMFAMGQKWTSARWFARHSRTTMPLSRTKAEIRAKSMSGEVKSISPVVFSTDRHFAHRAKE